MKRKAEFMMIFFLVIALGVISVFGFKKSAELSDKDKKEYAEWVQKNVADKKKQKSAEENKKAKEVAIAEENLDLNQKLQQGKPIKILVLGDGIALSQGKDTDQGSWDNGVVNWIKNTYKSDSQLKNLAEQGCTVARGNEILGSNDIQGFDLILTCFGQSDRNKAVNLQNFKDGYSNLIKSIKLKNPNGVIIPILPNTFSMVSDYREQIVNLAKENSLIVADAKAAFVNTGDEKELTSGVLPNDKGYKLYTQVIGDVIKQNIK